MVTTAHRAALHSRDRGCVAPGRTARPETCDAHHLHHWTHGGTTDLTNLALLCSWHHHLVHDQRWKRTRDPHTGTIELRPPPTPA